MNLKSRAIVDNGHLSESVSIPSVSSSIYGLRQYFLLIVVNDVFLKCLYSLCLTRISFGAIVREF